MIRFDWTIQDVVDATGLGYQFIRKALLSGKLKGIHASRLLRTNKGMVKDWLESMVVKEKSEIVELVQTATHKGQTKAFRHFDPSKCGG